MGKYQSLLSFLGLLAAVVFLGWMAAYVVHVVQVATATQH